MSERELIAQGKTKRVFVDQDPNYVILEAIDRLTAGDAAKIAEIGTIGSEKTRQCAKIFEIFEAAGIPTAYHDHPEPIQMRCHSVDMLPIEFVMRRYAYGSFLKRNPDLEPQFRFDEPLAELFHKAAVITPPLVTEATQISENDARDQYLSDDGWPKGVYTDPYLDAGDDEWRIYDAKKPVEGEPLLRMKPQLSAKDIRLIWEERLFPAFALLEEKLASADIALVDIKFEIGRRRDNGELVIADVVDNDSWRIWPGGDPKAQLDKQGFRDGDGIDDVLKNYKMVTQIVEAF